jgi:hypothetical protein
VSVKVLSWVYENSEARLGDRLVLLALADHAHDDGSGAYAKVETYAHKARLSERQARRALRNLEASGEIVVEGKHTSGTTIYRVVMGGQYDTLTNEAEGTNTTPDVPDLSPEPSEPSPSSETTSPPQSTNGADYVAFYIDESHRLSRYPTPQGAAIVGSKAKVLLADGVSDEHVRAAITLLVEKGRPPQVLPYLVAEVQAVKERGPFAEWVRANGWPTGSKFVRGANGGTFVQDTLGRERPTYDVPWGPPSRDELIAALRREGVCT